MTMKILSNVASAAILVCMLLCPTWGHADERSTTIRATEMREDPNATAKPVIQLAKDAEVLVVSRQPGWVRIEVSGKQGWVPAGHLKLQVAMGESVAAPRSSFLTWFTAVLKPDRARASTGSSAANRVNTATVGIRGLGEDGATAAKSNSEELQKLKLYSASLTDAEEFAHSSALVAAKVPYIN